MASVSSFFVRLGHTTGCTGCGCTPSSDTAAAGRRLMLTSVSELGWRRSDDCQGTAIVLDTNYSKKGGRKVREITRAADYTGHTRQDWSCESWSSLSVGYRLMGRVTDWARQHYLQQIINLPRLSIFFFFFWCSCLACGILVSKIGIEPHFRGSEVRAQSTKHWTTREFPGVLF